jgi:hypothetical protein
METYNGRDTCPRCGSRNGTEATVICAVDIDWVSVPMRQFHTVCTCGNIYANRYQRERNSDWYEKAQRTVREQRGLWG